MENRACSYIFSPLCYSSLSEGPGTCMPRMVEAWRTNQGQPATPPLAGGVGILEVREVPAKGGPGGRHETDHFKPKRYQAKDCDHVLITLLSPHIQSFSRLDNYLFFLMMLL